MPTNNLDLTAVGPTRGFSGLGGAGSSTHAFKVTNASAGGVAKIRVSSGRINALDAVTDGPFNVGDSPVFTLDVANGDRAYVDIELSYDSGTGIWSYVGYDVAAAATVPSATSTHAFYPICDVTVADNDVTAIGGEVAGNIGHERCGDSTTYSDKWWAGP